MTGLSDLLTMTRTERAYDFMIGATFAPVDRVRNAIAWRAAVERGEVGAFLNVYRRKRAEWLAWQTMTARKWQRETHRPSRARHHDSLDIRERYVTAGMRGRA